MGGRAGFSLGQIAAALGAALDGDGARVVTAVAPLASAGPADISFVTDGRYLKDARASRAGAFLAPLDIGELPAPALRCRAPRVALAQLLGMFHPAPPATAGVHPTAVVAPEARVHPTASIAALAVVAAGAVIGARARLFPLVYVGENAEVGEESVLYPSVVIRDGVRIGRRVVIHPGAVIGADGFGYAFDGTAHRKIPQVGGVVIEDDVEIGANATVDRAMLGQTVVRHGAKIDNLVQVGHNVEIGEHSVLAAQTGVAGSTRIGRYVVMGGQVGIGDHLTVGDGAQLAAQAGIIADVAAGERLWGMPARPVVQAKRIAIAAVELPELLRRVRAIDRRLRRLEARLGMEGDDRPAS
jgi:UDP-3-O-[3-hydroxymyristoyl] glucosamine N-acyltransferase